MNIIAKLLQWLFIVLKIVKYEGKDSKGKPITNGMNLWNPLSYVALIICSIGFGIVGFFQGVWEVWAQGLDLD